MGRVQELSGHFISTESKTKREEKHDFQFIETAMAEERDPENENSNQSRKINAEKQGLNFR